MKYEKQVIIKKKELKRLCKLEKAVKFFCDVKSKTLGKKFWAELEAEVNANGPKGYEEATQLLKMFHSLNIKE